MNSAKLERILLHSKKISKMDICGRTQAKEEKVVRKKKNTEIFIQLRFDY